MERLKATDLRIGNTVQYDNGMITTIQQGWELDEGMELYGIPLTEEWLDKFKFRKYNNIRFEHDMIPSDIVKGKGFYLADVTPEIKWVHQLQNAVYAITGEELEVKS